MVTAKKHLPCLQSVSNDAAIAMLADWCQCLNCAFKAVKKVRLSIFDDFEALIILVTTGLTCLHIGFLLSVIKVHYQKRLAETR